MKKFEMPELEIEKFQAMDVITSSDPWGDLGDTNKDDMGNI